MAASSIDPKVASDILAIVARHTNGATLNDIVAGLPDAPTRRTVQRWVSGLVKVGHLHADATVEPYRYRADTAIQPLAGGMSNHPPMSNDTGKRSLDSASSPGVSNPRPVSNRTGTAVSNLPQKVVSNPSSLDTPSPAGTGGMSKVRPSAVSNRAATAGSLDTGLSNRPSMSNPSLSSVSNDTGKGSLDSAPSPGVSNRSVVSNVGQPAVSNPRPVSNAAPSTPKPGRRSGKKAPGNGSVGESTTDDLTAAIRAVSKLATGKSAAGQSGDPLVKTVSNHVKQLVMLGLVTATGAVPAIVSNRPWLAVVLVAAAIAVGLVMSNLRRPMSVSNGDPDARQRLDTARVQRRYLLAVVLLAIAAGAGYMDSLRRPSKSAISDYLTTKLAPLPLHVAEVDPTYVSTGSSGCQVIYMALIEPTEALYQRLDTGDYLRTHLPAEMAAIDAANALLSGPNGGRIAATVAAPAPEPNVRDIVILTAESPASGRAIVTGTLTGWRRGFGWTLTGDVAYDRSRLKGEPWPAGAARNGPAATAFVINAPTDFARLKTLLSAHAAWAERVKANAEKLKTDLPSPSLRQAGTLKLTPAAPTDGRAGTPLPASSAVPFNSPSTPTRADIATASTASPRADAATATTADAGSAFEPTTQNPKPRTDAPAAQLKTQNSEPKTTAAPPPAFPAVPSAGSAAYVLAGQWLPLPRNNPHRSDTELTFDGSYYVPTVSGRDVVIAYVGASPAIELAPAKTAANGARSASLQTTAGVIGFGRDRVEATVERTTLRVISGGEVSAILLRCTAPLPAGRYAVLVGADAYELEIE